MTRPSNEDAADAKAAIQQFLAAHPTHDLAHPLRILLARTAPPTRDEAIPIMVQHANEAGRWQPQDTDRDRAIAGIEGTDQSTFAGSIGAQWKTLVHFNGGMP